MSRDHGQKMRGSSFLSLEAKKCRDRGPRTARNIRKAASSTGVWHSGYELGSRGVTMGEVGHEPHVCIFEAVSKSFIHVS